MGVVSAAGVGIGATSARVEAVVSMIISLFVSRFVAGVKLVMAFPAWSAIVPETVFMFRSLEVSPACTA
ncbi:MAG: hypothetical protein KAQ64_03525 [Candidatus Pacebacteria bacterium]|nr:hypothetical protein [Candidatus Paceibacterota bacterium]